MSHPSFWNDSILLMKVIVWFLIGGKTVSKCNFYLAPEFCISWIKYRQNLKKEVSDNINKKKQHPKGISRMPFGVSSFQKKLYPYFF